MMRPLFFLLLPAGFILLIAFCSCRFGAAKITAGTGADTTKIDTTNGIVQAKQIDQDGGSAAAVEDTGRTSFVELAHLDLPGYHFLIKAKMHFPPGYKPEQFEWGLYFEGDYLYRLNKKTKALDSVMIQELDDESPSGLGITDMTDSLRMKRLLLNITWQGDSDMYTSDFFDCRADSLSELFDITQLRSIKRKDQWTLEGFHADRDELVQEGETDYPFTVSLKDYNVIYVNPGKQEIGYPTRALENIKGWRMSRRSTDSSAYTIRKGTKVLVDTLYRDGHYVRLKIRDSIVVHVSLDEAQDKLQGNPAG
jgi:hypothetical protein